MTLAEQTKAEWERAYSQTSPLPMNGIGNANPNSFPGLADTYVRGQVQQNNLDTANAYYGPQSVMTDQAQELNANRLGLLNFDQEYQTMAMKRDSALARRKLELERGLVNGQLGNVEKLKALAAEQLANQKADFANSRAKTRDTAKRQQWDLRSDLTQRGAFNTVANQRGTGRIARDELYNLQSLNVQEQGAEIGYRQGMVGYDNQTLGLQNQLSGIGLNGEKLAYDLENALHNSGIGYFGNFYSLLEASQSLNAQEAAIAGQVLQMVGGMAGMTPQMIEALIASMGTGGSGAQPVPYKSPRVQ